MLAIALVLALNPIVNELRPLVEWLFPISSVVKDALAKVMVQMPNLAVTIGVFALLPAICEEFAFRGFILSGLESQHRTRSAILLSALMFGFLHVLLSLIPAALQRDAAGNRAGAPGGAQQEHSARAHFPLPE